MNKSKELNKIKRGRGRPEGVPSMRTQELYYLADKLDCNPFEILLHFAKGDYEALGYAEFEKTTAKDGSTYESYTISPDLRQKSAKDACEYLFPKRKAIEHTISPKDLPDKELIEETERLLKEAMENS